ncbi:MULTISPECIES: AraC family transcriptional regulator [unclassified Nocardia]|uniref:helix-turn-helix domain-containing protein n=1 Tax=unclassified Nocardia TaxID=2637762 RepID=UPI001CE42F1F|nr:MULTISPECIES: helix-turn-helix transcriptional regulator [unclassified Nocardia]
MLSALEPDALGLAPADFSCRGYTEHTAPHAALRGLVVGDYRHGRQHNCFASWRVPAHPTVLLTVLHEPVDGRLTGFVKRETRPYLVTAPPVSTAVCLTPLAAYRLFGPAAGEFETETVSLTDLFGGFGRRLGERIGAAANNAERGAVLNDFLVTRLSHAVLPTPQIVQAWRLILDTAGRMPIADIAAAIGWSHNHLIRRFKQHLGTTPKTMARLIRFQSLLRRINGPQRVHWGEVAAESGYSDQAHLHRDFHELAGVTPARYRARAERCGCMGAE